MGFVTTVGSNSKNIPEMSEEYDLGNLGNF